MLSQRENDSEWCNLGESKYLVNGRGLREMDVRRAIELSNTQFCSAAIMLGKTAEIVTSFEIEEEG